MAHRRVLPPVQRWLSHTPPPAVLALLYLAFILGGGLLLMMPFANRGGLDLLEALFTSVSAVTVTGLSVIDTEHQLTFWGQLVLAVLIQFGGLGLMTAAVLVFSAMGMQIGLAQHSYLREDLNQTSYVNLLRLVRTVFRVVLLAEIAGAMLLCLTFMPRYGLGPGLWHAAFHSVSAFNNAGFSTFSTGLVPFATDPIINIVVPALLIVGGLGYIVVGEIWRRPFWTGWSLHTRLMMVGTAVLIVAGVGLIAILEWNNPGTLGQFDSVGARLTVAWFQGVSPRTAGFNTTDIGALHDSTSLLMMALMIIGAGPTSTAGGLKVTTVVVVFLAAIAFLRRRNEIWIFGRSLGMEEVLKVMALIAISSVLIFTAIFAMTVAQEGHFLDISFEVASAFGTVGLTRNFTLETGDPARVILMLVMFLGRVGPLTLGFFLATRVTPRISYPRGQVHLG